MRNTRKYNNHKATINGEEFDSQKEANRYFDLLLLQRAGKIHNLERQVRFELIPTQREPDIIGKRGGVHKGKLLEKGVDYVADFVYIDDETGEKVVEDVKGYRDPSSAGYAKFVIKRKLMLWIHGIRIREV